MLNEKRGCFIVFSGSGKNNTLKFRWRIFAILMLLLFAVVGWTGAATAGQDMKGLFAFGWAKNFQQTPVFELPYIDGFTVYTGWDLTEPREGKYDWSLLDSLLEKAKENNKVINIGIFPGSSSPQWLFDKYKVSKFRWLRKLKEDQARVRGAGYEKQVSPLPWDPVYLDKWRNFVRALAARYGDENSVGYVALSGPSIRDFSMVIPLTSKESIKEFKGLGYSEERMIKLWIEMMDFYAEVFPYKKWALAAGPVIAGEKNPWIAVKVVDYGLKKYPNNLIVMGVYLNDTWFERSAKRTPIGIINDLIKRSSQYTIAGFQMAQSARRNTTWKRRSPIVKSLRRSIENGLELGISYLEVWHNADVIMPATNKATPEYVDDLKFVHKRLKGKSISGHEKYNGEFGDWYSSRYIK